jgi:hypothetical protein
LQQRIWQSLEAVKHTDPGFIGFAKPVESVTAKVAAKAKRENHPRLSRQIIETEVLPKGVVLSQPFSKYQEVQNRTLSKFDIPKNSSDCNSR